MKLLLFISLIFMANAMTKEERALVDIGYQIKYNETWRTAFIQQSQNVLPGMAPPPVPPFNCRVERSPSTPTSVHQLRPSDIRVVASFGDSITSGNGLLAENILEVILQERGHSWCIGGQHSYEQEVVTIPNILKFFNPDIVGHSTDESDVDDPEAGLNVARMGARSRHMPDQSLDMIAKMEASVEVDVQDDWKLVTLFIGGNDLCGYCRDRDNRSPANYAARIQEALDNLHENIPRAFVNLVPMFDVTPLRHMSTGWLCDILQQVFCSCAIDDETRDELVRIQQDYYTELKRLVDSGRYNTRDDFTVVLQPFLRDQKPPTQDDGSYDRSYFSPDCFHPNWKAHRGMTLGLWNSMFTPVGQKPLESDSAFLGTLRCPTPQNPYLFTVRNSGGSVSANKMDAKRPNPVHPDEQETAEGAGESTTALTATLVGVLVAVLLGALLLGVAIPYLRRRNLQKKAAENPPIHNPVFEEKA